MSSETCSQPLFIIGAPRSGTTFLVNVLNQHPSIHITNETRIFVLLKDMIDIGSHHQWLLKDPWQERFASYARRHAGAWVEQFYRDELAISEPIWGDKHPHYADPEVLRGRAVQIPGALSGSCLRLIRDCLPTAKFIHIHRDPRHVAWSLTKKGWVKSLEEGVEVWRRHIEEIEGFFREIGPGSQHVIANSDFRDDPKEVAGGISRFLELGEANEMVDFLIIQRGSPTPFSDPVTDPALPPVLAMSDEIGERLLGLAEPFAKALGYHN